MRNLEFGKKIDSENIQKIKKDWKSQQSLSYSDDRRPNDADSSLSEEKEAKVKKSSSDLSKKSSDRFHESDMSIGGHLTNAAAPTSNPPATFTTTPNLTPALTTTSNLAPTVTTITSNLTPTITTITITITTTTTAPEAFLTLTTASEKNDSSLAQRASSAGTDAAAHESTIEINTSDLSLEESQDLFNYFLGSPEKTELKISFKDHEGLKKIK